MIRNVRFHAVKSDAEWEAFSSIHQRTMGERAQYVLSSYDWTGAGGGTPIDAFLLYVDEKPVGFAGYSGELLREFGVDPGQQGKGYGAVLMERVLAEAQSSGEGRLWGFATHDSEGFFERMGFAAVSRGSAGRMMMQRLLVDRTRSSP